MNRARSAFGSIRFRLSVLYSSVVFGLGAVVLGLIYFFVRHSLRRLPVTYDSRLAIVNGQPFVIQQVDVDTAQLLEQAFTQEALKLLARYLLVGLGALFLLSLVVGWVIAGRALRPVVAITAVARDIEASDLSRRIDFQGPDDELGRLAATFDGMLARLDSAFRSQRRFLADTSHDLRTPLAVIRSNVDVIAADPAATLDDWRETGEIVSRNAERMGSMIDDLLATARLEAHASTMVTVDLGDLVSEAAQEFMPRGAAQDVSVEANPLSARVDGVAQSLRRAIVNLTDNALKAAPGGTRVVLASGENGRWAWVAVADEGVGIDPAIVESETGGGLGLAIVRQIVGAHRGRLTAHRGDVGGSTLVMWIPRTGEVGDPSSIPGGLKQVNATAAP